jgi:hypothetical protein
VRFWLLFQRLHLCDRQMLAVCDRGRRRGLFASGVVLLGRRDGWALKVYAVKYLIGRVVRAHDLDVDDRAAGKLNGLPRLAVLPRAVADDFPVTLVHAHLNVVGVGPVVAVPEQQPKEVNIVGRRVNTRRRKKQ